MKQKYSIKSNRKRYEGTQDNPDRNAHFPFINQKTSKFKNNQCSVLSVDTKKKNIGNFKNNDKEWSKRGKSVDNNAYNFSDKKKRRTTLYGAYDVIYNKGWINAGISSDTAEFAVASIRNWWKQMGERIYKDAPAIMITATVVEAMFTWFNCRNMSFRN